MDNNLFMTLHMSQIGCSIPLTSTAKCSCECNWIWYTISFVWKKLELALFIFTCTSSIWCIKNQITFFKQFPNRDFSIRSVELIEFNEQWLKCYKIFKFKRNDWSYFYRLLKIKCTVQMWKPIICFNGLI